MNTLAVMLAISLDPSLPPVTVQDVYFFGDLRRAQTIGEWTFMSQFGNGSWDRFAAARATHQLRLPDDFYRDVAFVQEAWNLLDNVMIDWEILQTDGPARSPDSLIADLGRLRRHLGPDAYYAGRMPSTLPFREIERLLCTPIP